MAPKSQQANEPVLAVEGNFLVLHWQDQGDQPLSIPLTKRDDPRLFGTPEFWKVGFVGMRADYNGHFISSMREEDDGFSENETVVVLTTQHQLHRVEGGGADDRLVLEPIRLEIVVAPSSHPKDHFNPSEFDTDPWWAFPEKRKPTRLEIWRDRFRRFF